MSDNLLRVIGEFSVDGGVVSSARFGSGHINDTYVVVTTRPASDTRYILQRINSRVFADIPGLMRNISCVLAEQHRRLEGGSDGARQVLTLIPTEDGSLYYRDETGAFWRMYRFVENMRAFDIAPTSGVVEVASWAFGQFIAGFEQLDATQLTETIPGFHDTSARLGALRDGGGRDDFGRVKEVQNELEFVECRAALTSRLAQARAEGDLPLRITHNDTKVNNVLIACNAFPPAGLSQKSAPAVCVIDLDTDRYRAIVRGFGNGAATALLPREWDCLVDGGMLMTLENGIRFLTDYLEGDHYYNTERNDHNLDRCRSQFRLLEEMELREETLRRIVTEERRSVRPAGKGRRRIKSQRRGELLQLSHPGMPCHAAR